MQQNFNKCDALTLYFLPLPVAFTHICDLLKERNSGGSKALNTDP